MQPGYDVYEDRCPTRLVLDRLADKWALLILDRLRDGPVRFNQLRRDIKGLSQKVLSQTLKKLERDGLVSRTVYRHRSRSPSNTPRRRSAAPSPTRWPPSPTGRSTTWTRCWRPRKPTTPRRADGPLGTDLEAATPEPAPALELPHPPCYSRRQPRPGPRVARPRAPRRGGRVVECTALEMRHGCKPIGSSNLPLSAKSF